MIIVEIVNGPIKFFQTNDNHQQDGAELIFNGRVRATEHGKNITALEYEQYEGMAETELIQLAEETVGKINVGETSLHVVIWSKHRKEGLEAMTWFITELKKRVPIWKWAIMEDGRKIPSECSHE